MHLGECGSLMSLATSQIFAFEVTHPIELHGIRLFGAKNSNYSVTLELINVENSGQKVWLEGLLLGIL